MTSSTTGAELVFVDTNVLLYSLDTSNPLKSAAARRWLNLLWSTRQGRLSWQVLNECYENATRKLRIPPLTARTVIETFADWELAEFSLPLLRRAWRWMDTAGVGYWDSLILAAAEDRACRYLLSEDFQPGRVYGEVRVINPFETEAEPFFRH